MNNLVPFGFWTCAALYTAIGVVGIFLFSTQPNLANATDGYGLIHVQAQK
jgi:hypothetical protein